MKSKLLFVLLFVCGVAFADDNALPSRRYEFYVTGERVVRVDTATGKIWILDAVNEAWVLVRLKELEASDYENQRYVRVLKEVPFRAR